MIQRAQEGPTLEHEQRKALERGPPQKRRPIFGKHTAFAALYVRNLYH